MATIKNDVQNPVCEVFVCELLDLIGHGTVGGTPVVIIIIVVIIMVIIIISIIIIMTFTENVYKHSIK